MKLIYFNFYHIRLSQVPGYATLTRPPSGTGFATPSLTFQQCLSYATTFIVALRFERQHAPSGCTLGSQAPASRTEFPRSALIVIHKCLRNTVILAGMTDPVERVANPVTRDVKDRRHPESNMRGSKITLHGARYLHPCR